MGKIILEMFTTKRFDVFFFIFVFNITNAYYYYFGSRLRMYALKFGSQCDRSLRDIPRSRRKLLNHYKYPFPIRFLEDGFMFHCRVVLTNQSLNNRQNNGLPTNFGASRIMFYRTWNWPAGNSKLCRTNFETCLTTIKRKC